MKMTNLEMSNAVILLDQLKEQGALGLAIAKNLRRLSDEAKEYMEKRNEALSKYGDVQDDGQVRLDVYQARKFNEEMADMDSLTAEVDVCTVPEKVFISGTLTSQQMEGLLWMVEDESCAH